MSRIFSGMSRPVWATQLCTQAANEPRAGHERLIVMVELDVALSVSGSSRIRIGELRTPENQTSEKYATTGPTLAKATRTQ